MLPKPGNRLADAIGRLVFGGSGSLRPYERAIILEAGSALNPPAHDLLAAQMNAVHRCQREHHDRMVLISTREPRTFPTQEDVEILRGEIQSAKRDYRSSFSVYTSLGRLRTIEFRKSPTRFLDQAFVVTHLKPPWPKRRELAERINNQEHG